jgi:uncharacterized damage-inducible protein DinB
MVEHRRFHADDLSGAVFRECDLSGARIVGCIVSDLRISGFGGGVGRVVVEDVDVTGYVEAELDRRFPERVALRGARTAAELRAVWAQVERLWAGTLAAARALPEEELHRRVDDEWSFVETLRHLVFAVDVWVGRMLRAEPAPFHPLGLPPTDMPAAEAAGLGLDPAARPAFDEVVAVHAGRAARMSAAVGAVTDEQLDEVRTGVPAPSWGEESRPVRACLRVVINEHVAHRRFALRDLPALSGS